MSDLWRPIALVVKLDGRQVESETVCVSAGAHAVTIVTALPEIGLAFEQTSAFVGHVGIATHATHLTLGPPGHDPTIRTVYHDHDTLDFEIGGRKCVYEHIHVTFEELTKLGYDVAIDVPDDAFDELERVET